MDAADRQAKLVDLFGRAADLPAGDRGGFIERECGRDAQLRGELETLLGYRDAPCAVDTPPNLAGAGAELLGGGLPERVGAFRIIRRLGIGGMGVVYLAEQDRPRRLVALKVVLPMIATPQLVRRLEREAEILGRLVHPGIARLYEAGTQATADADRPYLAMELVEGTPITGFAEGRGLDLRARVELFARLCDAVQYAHGRGVIHRDLKPSNVLVGDPTPASPGQSSDPPQPKVLDFGIARIAGDDAVGATLRTAAGQLLGTLQYMSPEQLSHDPADLDVRTDVYSLGVMLYELLTKRPPFNLGSRPLPSAVRMVTEEEPPRAAAIERSLRGDMDAIVAKAMCKDRSRRYQTAADLGADLRRFLADERVMARGPLTIHDIRKFVRRNRVPLFGAAAIAVVVTAGAGWGWQTWRAKLSDRAASASLVSKTNAMKFFEDAFAAADPEAVGGDKVDVMSAVEHAAQSIPTVFAGDAEGEAAAHATVGKIYASRGKLDEAEPHLSRWLALVRTRFGPASAEAADAQEAMASLRYDQGRYDEAASLYGSVLATRHRTGGDGDRPTLVARSNLALAWEKAGRTKDAEKEFRAVLATQTGLFGDGDRDTQATANNLANLLTESGHLDEAELIHRRVLEARLASRKETDPDTLRSMNALAVALITNDKPDEALPLLDRCYRLRVDVLGPNHPATLDTQFNLATLLIKQNKLAEAERLLRDVADREASIPDIGPDAILLSRHTLSLVIQRQGRFEEAEPISHQVLETSKDPQSGADETMRAICLLDHGQCLTGLRRFDEAERELLDAEQALRGQLDANSPHVRSARAALFHLYEAWGRPEDAARWRPSPAKSGG